jgi:hypothetical protein
MKGQEQSAEFIENGAENDRESLSRSRDSNPGSPPIWALNPIALQSQSQLLIRMDLPKPL